VFLIERGLSGKKENTEVIIVHLAGLTQGKVGGDLALSLGKLPLSTLHTLGDRSSHGLCHRTRSQVALVGGGEPHQVLVAKRLDGVGARLLALKHGEWLAQGHVFQTHQSWLNY
jgi:hypothetical protein